MLNNISNKLGSIGSIILSPKKSINNAIKDAIRDKAIKQAKNRLMQLGVTVEEAGDKFEVFVQEEETIIKSELKDKSILAIFLALGLQVMTT